MWESITAKQKKMTNRKFSCTCAFESTGTKVDDLWIELLKVRIFGEFRWISQIWKATTAKRMKIDPHCQLLICRSFIWAFIHPLLSRATLALARLSCIVSYNEHCKYKCITYSNVNL